MPRKPALTAEEKGKLVLQVIGGSRTLADAARDVEVSTQAVVNWRKQFIEAGVRSFSPARKDAEAERRLRELHGQIRSLKLALADAHLALREFRRRTLHR
ncbi:transposase [Nocardia sp. NPDC051570]|uniref:transposase n=1 Tax=Nocardia sp. NPDC051570 TaxID=3364324 RepID=UPI0037BC05FC